MTPYEWLLHHRSFGRCSLPSPWTGPPWICPRIQPSLRCGNVFKKLLCCSYSPFCFRQSLAIQREIITIEEELAVLKAKLTKVGFFNLVVCFHHLPVYAQAHSDSAATRHLEDQITEKRERLVELRLSQSLSADSLEPPALTRSQLEVRIVCMYY